jgi:hypothetical protein
VAASRLGGPDLDLISFAEMFDSFGMVRGAAPETLVLADGDHGYGNAMNVQRTVRAYGRAGAAAILIEDKVTPRALTAAGKPLPAAGGGADEDTRGNRAAKESGILVLARTDCRPTQASTRRWPGSRCSRKKARHLFLDSPADDGEIRRAVAQPSGRTGLQDRHLSDGPALAGGGRDEGRAGGPGHRRGGGGKRLAAGGAPRGIGVSGLRCPGAALRRAGERI